MRVKVVEVGPRDGFQSVKEFIPAKLKLKIIEDLIETGIKKIQIGSFVSPKAIPQMQNTQDIFKQLDARFDGVEFYALVPNLKGALFAANAGLKEVSIVISVSHAHNKANVNKSHDESFAELEKILQSCPNLKVNVDVATAFGCPFEGEILPSAIKNFIERAYKLGVRNFNLCDTIGVAYPTLVEKTVKEMLDSFGNCEFDIHIHDTRNMGIVNTLTAIANGITNVQSTLGGLGGCPFAPGASGNTATEDLVYMLEKMNIDTDIDFKRLLKTAKYQKENVQGNYSGHHINIDTTAPEYL